MDFELLMRDCAAEEDRKAKRDELMQREEANETEDQPRQRGAMPQHRGPVLWHSTKEIEMSNTNKVTGPHSAQVGGKPTALAGCAAGSCPRAQRCLRADAALAMRHPHNCGADGQFFIPIAPAV